VTGNLNSVSKTAKTWGVSPFTVRRLIAAGEVKAVHVGARVLIPTTEVDRVIAHGIGKPRSLHRRKPRARL
jgi:excisionase family DNA binding protein